MGLVFRLGMSSMMVPTKLVEARTLGWVVRENFRTNYHQSDIRDDAVVYRL